MKKSIIMNKAELDRRPKADQMRLTHRQGGREALLKNGPAPYSAVPHGFRI